MFHVQADDITVPWGRAPDPMDVQTGRYRMAVFQDVQESLDKSKLYFLYDPVADEQSGTSGARKGSPGLVVFDVNRRCFVSEIPIFLQGSLKFLFGLKCPSPSGGSSIVLATMNENYGQSTISLWRLNLNAQGVYLEGEPRALLNAPITAYGGDMIVAMREDAPECVVMTGPGLVIHRINCLVDHPGQAVDTFSVPGADITHFYDAFLSRGNCYFLSSSPDGHFDNSRVHVLQLDGDRQIKTQHCQPDPQRGMPPARKQAALASTSGFILLAGGEIEHGSSVTRLVDYWVLNLNTFTWMQIPAQMPVPLIEPRLTVSSTDNAYLWGDFDQPLPGMPTGTHLRIIRIAGINMNPPSYEDALKQPTTAPYPTLYPSTTTAGGAGPTPYPDSSVGFGQAQPPPPYGIQSNVAPAPYPQQQQQAGYPTQYPTSQPQAGYPAQYPTSQPQAGYPAQYSTSSQPQNYPQAPQGSQGQYAHYPPGDNKKDCVIQ